MVLAVVGAVLAAITGSDLVLLFSGLGGLSGLSALLMVWVNYRSGQRKAEQDDRSVAIVELEKAVPGMGDIIKEWQGVVGQLQSDNSALRAELRETKDQLADCQRRVAELERGVAPS